MLVGAVVVVLFLVAVALGARDDDTDLRGLIDGFGERDPAGQLTVADLKGSCELDAAEGAVTVIGACRLDVPEGGGLSFAGQARSLVLRAAAGSTTVATEVQGLNLRKRVDPGDDIDLRFGSAAGTVGLTCRGPVPTCVMLVGDT